MRDWENEDSTTSCEVTIAHHQFSLKSFDHQPLFFNYPVLLLNAQLLPHKLFLCLQFILFHDYYKPMHVLLSVILHPQGLKGRFVYHTHVLNEQLSNIRQFCWFAAHRANSLRLWIIHSSYAYSNCLINTLSTKYVSTLQTRDLVDSLIRETLAAYAATVLSFMQNFIFILSLLSSRCFHYSFLM